MEATILKDKEIRNAIDTLRVADACFAKKIKNHSQHKKVERTKWAMYGCEECFLKLM